MEDDTKATGGVPAEIDNTRKSPTREEKSLRYEDPEHMLEDEWNRKGKHEVCYNQAEQFCCMATLASVHICMAARISTQCHLVKD